MGSVLATGETVAESVRSLLRFAHIGLALGVLVLVGLSALVVPGFVLATMLWDAVPSAVVERRAWRGAWREALPWCATTV